jgi:hypothetical protein
MEIYWRNVKFTVWRESITRGKWLWYVDNCGQGIAGACSTKLEAVESSRRWIDRKLDRLPSLARR